MATSESKCQIPFRATGQTTCIHHKGRQLELYCEICQEPACTKCLSTVHKSHTVCDLSEITPKKKEDIQNFVDNTEDVDLVQINQLITSTDTQLKDNVSHFEKLSNQLKIQTNKLKEDLDQLTAQTLSLYQQMEEDNTKLLQTYKKDLESYGTQLKMQMQECKLALQRGSHIQIYDTGCEIQSSVSPPVKPTLGTASFTPNKNPQGQLKQALGDVYTSGQGQGQALLVHELSVGSSAEQGSVNTQQRSETKGYTPTTQKQSERTVKISPTQQTSTGREEVASPVYTLLPTTKVLGEWWSPCEITSVCPTTDGQVWTSDGHTLTLLDRKGKVIQKSTHNTLIRDISLSSTTNTLWICDYKNIITELASGRLVQRFSTTDNPHCICITASNHVIVGMANYISKFTTKGALVQQSSAVWVDWPIPYTCTTYRISECPVTHNVAVTYKSIIYEGGALKPRVIVIDTDFNELFVYQGEVPNKYQSTSQSRGKVFTPYGVVYDSVGNLVIGEHYSKRVLLISGRGEFLRIIHTNNNIPRAICVDREDVLWAVFGSTKVKLLQYSCALDKQQCIIS